MKTKNTKYFNFDQHYLKRTTLLSRMGNYQNVAQAQLPTH